MTNIRQASIPVYFLWLGPGLTAMPKRILRLKQKLDRGCHAVSDIRNWSLTFDLQIIIMTVLHAFNSKNAY